MKEAHVFGRSHGEPDRETRHCHFMGAQSGWLFPNPLDDLIF